MPHTSSLTGRPQTLWEAVGQLSNIQTQEQIALDNGDIELFQKLLDEQAQAWQVVYVQAAELIAIGKAPPDMIPRLEKILNIHRDHEQRLQEAKKEDQAKLEQLEGERQATNAYKAQQMGKLAA